MMFEKCAMFTKSSENIYFGAYPNGMFVIIIVILMAFGRVRESK